MYTNAGEPAIAKIAIYLIERTKAPEKSRASVTLRFCTNLMYRKSSYSERTVIVFLFQPTAKALSLI